MMKKIKKRDLFSKRGVSPVVATIVLVAVTLVAAVSVGGYISGLFGGFTSSQTMSSAQYYGGAAPVFSFTISNSGSAVNVTQITLSGPGITGVYTWTPDAAWQFANPMGNGATAITLQTSTSPTFAPGTLTTQGTSYTAVVNFANGRSVTQNLVAQ